MPTPQQPLSNNQRLLSLDALRGFDMFWIISGEGIFHGLANVVMEKHHLTRNSENWRLSSSADLNSVEQVTVFISNQLHHSVWNGFTFYDLIFPLFIFIAGVAMPFAFDRYFQMTDKDEKQKAKTKIYYSLIKRTVLLTILGMVVNGLLQWQGYENTRFASVLGRIGLATFFAALIYLNSASRNLIFWFSGICLVYWVMLALIEVPTYGAGVFTPQGNLTAYIDRLFLPGKLHRIFYDPEGLLSTFPSIASALLGIIVGQYIKLKKKDNNKLSQLTFLFALGLCLILIGWGWNFMLPINKTMWTSSFVCYAGGWSVLLLAFFYAIIDCYKFQNWSKPFIWIGSNSILIYIAAHGLVNFEHISYFIFGGVIKQVPNAWRSVLIWLGICLIQLWFLRLLYHKKWFLKL